MLICALRPELMAGITSLTPNLPDTRCAAWVDYDGAFVERTLIKFAIGFNNVSGRSLGYAPRARLLLWLNDMPHDPFPELYRYISLHVVQAPWGKGVTWSAQPPWGDTKPVTRTYFDNQSAVDQSGIRDGTLGYYAWDVTAMVNGWLSGGNENHGLLVKLEDESPDPLRRRSIGSSFGVNQEGGAVVEHRPVLWIET